MDGTDAIYNYHCENCEYRNNIIRDFGRNGIQTNPHDSGNQDAGSMVQPNMDLSLFPGLGAEGIGMRPAPCTPNHAPSRYRCLIRTSSGKS